MHQGWWTGSWEWSHGVDKGSVPLPCPVTRLIDSLSLLEVLGNLINKIWRYIDHHNNNRVSHQRLAKINQLYARDSEGGEVRRSFSYFPSRGMKVHTWKVWFFLPRSPNFAADLVWHWSVPWSVLVVHEIDLVVQPVCASSDLHEQHCPCWKGKNTQIHGRYTRRSPRRRPFARPSMHKCERYYLAVYPALKALTNRSPTADLMSTHWQL